MGARLRARERRGGVGGVRTVGVVAAGRELNLQTTCAEGAGPWMGFGASWGRRPGQCHRVR
eukprot:1917318-Pyramimonas_sp.AAC.1